ncbi:hypothetical protein SAMD00019534_097250 [Acytostelium subglobosum LB1]|uniref:hypothetical protein n=1 Tax=Acytostelium subglobosum LB1 TaxID=1410327 RepID=UPI000644F437|nr:hypothetical protein SAMD00019534_097250 [Acytostelium subglobosum LB1]GAM26550.1 hypothetical protein SAMD00019534_097250 [Acytostelium subglobosum LB1]|eukprot:XP_012750646.1 hypothetical protein SAMD00019534_097250 [Acytostelium subglobosum LB1]
MDIPLKSIEQLWLKYKDCTSITFDVRLSMNSAVYALTKHKDLITLDNNNLVHLINALPLLSQVFCSDLFNHNGMLCEYLKNLINSVQYDTVAWSAKGTSGVVGQGGAPFQTPGSFASPSSSPSGEVGQGAAPSQTPGSFVSPSPSPSPSPSGFRQGGALFQTPGSFVSPSPPTPGVTIDWRQIHSMPDIKVSLIDVSTALMDVWDMSGEIRNRSMYGQTTKMYLLSPELFDTLLANTRDNDNGDADEQRSKVFNIYIKLLRYNLDMYQRVTSVFGLDRVETQLTQWFMLPSKDSDRRLQYLWAIPNKSSSQLLINHKLYVREFLQSYAGDFQDQQEQLLAEVFNVILDDPTNNDANQRWIISMLEEMNQSSRQWYRTNAGFRLFHQFIQPIDHFLRFFHQLDTPNMCTLITSLGPSFQQHYKKCEPFIIVTLDRGLEGLAMLQGITKSFGVSDVAENSLCDLLEYVNRLPLDASTFAFLIKKSLFGNQPGMNVIPTPQPKKNAQTAYGRTSAPTPIPPQPTVTAKPQSGPGSQFVFKNHHVGISDVKLGMIIDGLLGVAELMMLHPEKYDRVNDIMDAWITALLRVNQYRVPNEYDIINKHRQSIGQFVAKHRDVVQKTPADNPFLLAITRHSLLDAQLIKDIGFVGAVNNLAPYKQILDACPANSDRVWIDLIDKHIQFSAHDHQLYLHFVAACTRAAPIFHILKYRHYQKHVFFNRQTMPTKSQLLVNVQRDDGGVFEQQQQLYKQFKKTSIARIYPDWKMKHPPPVDGNTLPPLSTLIIKHVVMYLVFNDDRTTKPNWIVTLSTVSSQFHQAVSYVVSNFMIPTLRIHSPINHLGSNHCLFKSPPLHIDAFELSHIPKTHINTCLDRLESLVIPLCFMSYYRIVLIEVRAPNVRHIKFKEYFLNDRSAKYKLLNDWKHWAQFGSRVGFSKVKRDREGRCNDQFFSLLFQLYLGQNAINTGSSVLQSIEIVSRSPVGPPTPPSRLNGRVNIDFTWDLESLDKYRTDSGWIYEPGPRNDDQDGYNQVTKLKLPYEGLNIENPPPISSFPNVREIYWPFVERQHGEPIEDEC